MNSLNAESWSSVTKLKTIKIVRNMAIFDEKIVPNCTLAPDFSQPIVKIPVF
jgi:hypothetical protein